VAPASAPNNKLYIYDKLTESFVIKQTDTFELLDIEDYCSPNNILEVSKKTNKSKTLVDLDDMLLYKKKQYSNTINYRHTSMLLLFPIIPVYTIRWLNQYIYMYTTQTGEEYEPVEVEKAKVEKAKAEEAEAKRLAKLVATTTTSTTTTTLSSIKNAKKENSAVQLAKRVAAQTTK
jgi:hypothetical protein